MVSVKTMFRKKTVVSWDSSLLLIPKDTEDIRKRPQNFSSLSCHRKNNSRHHRHHESESDCGKTSTASVEEDEGDSMDDYYYYNRVESPNCDDMPLAHLAFMVQSTPNNSSSSNKHSLKRNNSPNHSESNYWNMSDKRTIQNKFAKYGTINEVEEEDENGSLSER